MSSSADDAFITQLLTNIAHTLKPTSNVAAAVAEYFQKYLGHDSSYICNLKTFDGYINSEFNYFKWHTYLILYLMAPVSLLIGSSNTLAIANTLTVLSLLVFTSLFCKREGNLNATFVIYLIILSLPHLQGLVFGQFYIDRLFIGIFPAWVYFATQAVDSSKRSLNIGLIITSLLFISISERFALIFPLIIFYLLATKLIRRYSLKDTYNYIGLFLLSIILFLIEIKLFISYDQNDSFGATLISGLKEFPGNILDPSVGISLFITLNIIQFLFLFKYSPRWYVLAYLLMIPNIFGDIGGAEKIGYYTHYHSIYFPILMVALATSVPKFINKNSKWLSSLLLILFLLLNNFAAAEGVFSLKSKLSSTQIAIFQPRESFHSNQYINLNLDPENTMNNGIFIQNAKPFISNQICCCRTR